MSEFMHQVAKVWYRVYWALMLCFSVGLTIASAVVVFFPGLNNVGETFGLGTTSLVFASIHTVYSLTGYWLVARSSQPFASLIGSMLMVFVLLNGINQTNPDVATYLYIAMWVAQMLFSGFFGPPFLMGGVFMVYLFVLLENDFAVLEISQPMYIFMVLVLLAAIGSYYFWRRRFVDIEMQEVNQLSGMLRNNQQQSEILIQSIADGIIVTNTEGKITIMNPMAAVMTEWPVEEATSIDVKVVVKLSLENGTELRDDENPFAQVLQDKKRLNKALQLTGRNGSQRYISLVISPIVPPNETTPIGAVAVMRDISEERTAEKQRAEFISTASHEMRTPVAAIEGYLALALNDKVSQIDSKARSFLEKAHSSTQHLGKLFQDLLTSSKAEDGRLTSHPVVVEMGTFMQQLTDDLKFAADKKGLASEFVIGGANATVDTTTKDASQQHLLKPLYYVYADPDRMREVVTNLFDNACKYTDAGKISIGLTGDAQVVQIYVRDTGAGIPATDVPHLFQKFYRVDNTATRTIGGTGLGLFICRKIVELYQGRIWVESTVGKGSTFLINLPRLSNQKAMELQASEDTKSGIKAPETPTVTPPSTA
jgi:PAS domain S-box-containing protein